MRTTLDIDDDILQAVKELARSQKTTAGRVISELARKQLTGTGTGTGAGSGRTDSAEYVVKNGWIVRRSGGAVITNEEINRIKDELDQEEVDDANALGYQRLARIDD